MDIQDSRNCGEGSSKTREKSFDVFLSFSGRDTPSGFVDHLHRSLLHVKISVSMDDGERTAREEKGTQAIRNSKIAIPILSENYLSSMSCHAKLAQIVKCHKCSKTTGQIIMPVFFNVSPTVVKKGSPDYAKAIARHRQENPKTLQEWKEALIHLGFVSGGTSNCFGTDASLIDELVANVLRALNRYLVDIEHDVERVMELLDEKSSDVRVVGIHGTRGTGKTTIAKLICTRMFHLFDGWSFLERVGECEERQLGLKILRGQLFSDLLGETHGQISSFEERIKLLKDQFVRMKFLIILDDVGASFRLEQILINRDWLGSGSRIIITTRKVQALAELEGSRIHEVMGMQKGDALKLFHTHAFRERPVLNDFHTLSEKIVSSIDWRPSTIEVIGSYLCSKTKDKWEQTLNKLQKVNKLEKEPRPRVQHKLKVIFDALPRKQREIFLDIACFFTEEDESVACYLWFDRSSASGSVLKVLVDLSIVKIENGKLWMHNDLRDLGRDIALPKNLEPEKCSRLWSHKRALDVLKNEKGTEILEGVVLEFGSQSHHSFGPAHFAGTSSIRFLQLDQADLIGNFKGCLSSLRWLHWQGCPWNLRAKNLGLEELVILDLSWSMVHEKWNGWIQIQKAKKLKVLNLTGCVHLIKTPDLSHFKCLERLILERCTWLDEIGPSVKSLQCLVSLNLRFCTELKKLPHELGSLTSLEDILIDETAIQEIPASIGDLQKLKRFSACNCLSLTQLPESISHVESLEILTLNGTKISKLPLSKELGVLQYLSISNCRLILSLPTSMGTLASLSELDLSSTGINELPDTVNESSLLRVLKIDSTFVRKLPPAIWKLKRLEELHASRCRSLEGEIPRQINMLSALRVLKLGYSRICSLPDSISELPNLQTLDLLHCDQLCEVPELSSSLISLSVSSKLMDRIPDISRLVKLGELFLGEGSQEPVLRVQDKIEEKECTLQLEKLSELKILQLSALKIQLLPVGLHYLYKLRKLSLCCIHLKKLPRLPPGLFTLSLRHYKSKTMPDLSYLVLLSEFELFDCAVTEVPGLGKFKSLQVFRVSHCDLQQVDELENLIFLASLNVSYCQSLERLPDLLKLTMLKDIEIEGCPMIRDDFYDVDSHLNFSEERSSSLIEADRSSKGESSKPAKTKHSSFKGVEPICEGNEGSIDNSRELKIGKIGLSGKTIGKGSNGTIVVEGKYEKQPAAVKRILRNYCDVADNEIHILRKSDLCENIVRYYGFERDQHFVYLALELCTCTLDDLIQEHSDPSNNLPDDPASIKASVRDTKQDFNLRLLDLMRDMVKGLSQLHSLRIIHRDLKPTNVLITKNPFRAKLSDMGMIRCLPDDRSSSGYHATSCGTKGYQAPEVSRDGGRQTQAMDLFSLGCVLFFCVTRGKHLFGENIAFNNPNLSLVKDMPEAHDLISRLLSQDPKSRPKASEVIHHPFFWSSKMRLTFLHDFSDEVELETRKGNSHLLKELEKIAQLIFDGNWIEKIEDVMDDLRWHVRKPYDGCSVRDLLRVVRNKFNHNHMGTAPKNVKEILGSNPGDLDAYFAKKFPKLLIESYKVVSQSYKKEKLLAGVLSK